MQTPDEARIERRCLRLKALGEGVRRIAARSWDAATIGRFVERIVRRRLTRRGRGRRAALTGLRGVGGEAVSGRHAGNADVVRQELAAREGDPV